MSEFDSLAFQPGQQVQCKTRVNDVLIGEVVAFDLKSKILAIKSTATSGTSNNNNTYDIHFLVLDNVSGVEVLKEPPADSPNDILPSIDMKFLQDRKDSAVNERLKLVEACGNGVSKDGLLLFAEFSKKYNSSKDVSWRDKVKIVVLNQVIISPPYKEADCQSLNPKSNDAVPYIKKVVSHYWESKAK